MKYCFLVLTAVLLPGCANHLSNDPVVLDSRNSGLANRGMLFDQYNRDQIGGWPDGKVLASTDNKRVRYDEHIQTYHLGRLPSKDRNSMSEAHRVYQIRESNRWDLRLPVNPRDSTGVVMGVKEPTNKSLPSDVLIRAERKRQAEISDKLAESHRKIQELEHETREKVRGFQNAKDVIVGMRSTLEDEIKKRKSLEQELQTAKREESAAKAELEDQKRVKDLKDWKEE